MLCAKIAQNSQLARTSLLQVGRASNRQNIARVAVTRTDGVNNLFSTSPTAMSGDHSKVWSMEKGVSLALVPGIIVPFIYTTPVTDGIFCAMMTLHSFWHTEAMVVDYIRPKLFGGNPLIPNICRALCFALHAFILGALFYYNYTDIGIINTIKMFWKL